MTKALTLLLCKILLLLAANSAHALDPVTLQLKWQHQFQFAGYYAAKQQGYYQAAGLDVTFKPAAPEDSPIDIVLSGEAEYGVSSSNLILALHDNKPVVALAVILQHSPFVLIAPKHDDITSIQDLAGKCIMYEQGADEIRAYFAHSGMDFDPVNTTPHTLSVKSFINSGCEAMTAYITDETFYFNKHNLPYMMFTPRSEGIDFYGDNLFTTKSELEKNPKRVKAFRQASLKGWEYALAHPEEISQLIIDEYSSLKTKEQLLYEAEKMQGLIHPELIELGYMLPGRWKHIAETYAELKMLPNNLSLEGFLYEPNPKVNLKPFYIGGAIGILVLTIISLIAWRFSRLNKRLDALLTIKSKYANVGEIFDNITHQWKQPLNHLGIQVMRIEQLNTSSNPNQKAVEELLDKSNETIQFLSDTTDVFRELFKEGSGKPHTDNHPFNPTKTIQASLQLMEESFHSLGVDLSITLEKDITLFGNPSELSHVFLSLLVNARNIFRNREIEKPTLYVSLARKEAQVLITFEDNGGGIALYPLESIFKRGVSSQDQPDAAGIGLFIARKLIIEKFNGSLKAKNTQQGAAFTIQLPICNAE